MFGSRHQFARWSSIAVLATYFQLHWGGFDRYGHVLTCTFNATAITGDSSADELYGMQVYAPLPWFKYEIDIHTDIDIENKRAMGVEFDKKMVAEFEYQYHEIDTFKRSVEAFDLEGFFNTRSTNDFEPGVFQNTTTCDNNLRIMKGSYWLSWSLFVTIAAIFFMYVLRTEKDDESSTAESKSQSAKEAGPCSNFVHHFSKYFHRFLYIAFEILLMLSLLFLFIRYALFIPSNGDSLYADNCLLGKRMFPRNYEDDMTYKGIITEDLSMVCRARNGAKDVSAICGSIALVLFMAQFVGTVMYFMGTKQDQGKTKNHLVTQSTDDSLYTAIFGTAVGAHVLNPDSGCAVAAKAKAYMMGTTGYAQMFEN